MYLRPSRYAEADKFYGFAATEFGNYVDSTTLLEKVSSWVGTRLNYVPGSSDPIDGAVDTLLAGAGCRRDYAHLVVALLRAVNVPARARIGVCAGVVPDGLPRRRRGATSRDNGASSTAHCWRRDRRWCASPPGRDAADTAFLDNHKGSINLNKLAVTAIVDGDLPVDSVDELVSIG